METGFFFCVYALVVWLCLYGIYWALIRPVILSRLQFSINSIQDELLLRSESNDPKADRILLTRCERAKIAIDHITLQVVLTCEAPAGIDEQIKAERIVLDASSDANQRLNLNLSSIMVLAMMANSPIFSGFGLCIMAGMTLFSSSKRRFNSVADNAWEVSSMECRAQPA